MSTDRDKAREIIKKISDAAIGLAFVRHDLTSDEVDIDEDAPVKERVAANEEFMERVKEDTLNCLTGDDTGCFDESELDATNCELIWLQLALSTVRRETWEAAIETAQGSVKKSISAGLDVAAAEILIRRLELAALESAKGKDERDA